MDAMDTIRIGLETSDMIAMAYLDDLSDREMLMRPVDSSNHVTWQLGHLILSEHRMISMCKVHPMPELPDGFPDRYDKSRSWHNLAKEFDSKAFLLSAYRVQRQGTLEALSKCTSELLDQPTDESIRSYAPTVGSAFVMQNTHWMMHAGQWAVLRRKLGKKILF